MGGRSQLVCRKPCHAGQCQRKPSRRPYLRRGRDRRNRRTDLNYDKGKRTLSYTVQADGLPFFVEGLQNTWTVRPDGAERTAVDVEINATTKGLIGRIGSLPLGRMLAKGAAGLPGDLKTHIEEGRETSRPAATAPEGRSVGVPTLEASASDPGCGGGRGTIRPGPPTSGSTVHTPLQELQDLGQSVWSDNIHRTALADDTLQQHIEQHAVTGVMSNPSIFERAISGSDDYDAQIRQALHDGIDDPETLFWEVAIRHIQDAADLLRAAHDDSGGTDGFVSLELPPRLLRDKSETL